LSPSRVQPRHRGLTKSSIGHWLHDHRTFLPYRMIDHGGTPSRPRPRQAQTHPHRRAHRGSSTVQSSMVVNPSYAAGHPRVRHRTIRWRSAVSDSESSECAGAPDNHCTCTRIHSRRSCRVEGRHGVVVRAASSFSDHPESVLVRPHTWFEVRPRSRSTARNGWPL
jgi:hypothetical protein